MATASILLDRSRTLKGTRLHPVCIRVTHNRKQWTVGMKLYATEQDYHKAMGQGTLNQKQKELRDTIIEHRTKAQNILDELKVVTLHTFKQHFFASVDIHKVMNNVDITTHFNAYAQSLRDNQEEGNAVFYENALKALLLFRGNTNLTDIDEDYLKKFVVYWKGLGNSKATAQAYLSKLRAVFNKAIKQKVIPRSYYPFGMDGYSIGTSTQSKKALFPEQVKQLWEYKATTPSQREALDFWFLSYLCYGANNMDIMRLKWKNVSVTSRTISFVRSKTKNTDSEQRSILIHMTDELAEIITRHCGEKRAQNDYVFPLLYGKTHEADIYKAVKDWRRHINRCLGRIGKRLGFDMPVSMSIARHSFSTALKLKGTPIAVISDCLGHASMKTTEHYLSTIPDNMKKEISSTLLDFGKPALKAV